MKDGGQEGADAGADADSESEQGQNEAQVAHERQRIQQQQAIEQAEAQRIKGVDREREAAAILLRNAARAAVAAKRASVVARG